MQNNKAMDEEKAEPKENARMVENHDKGEKELDGGETIPTSGSRWDELRQRAKHFSSNRYNLIIVLLCLLLLVFFIIIIGLAARLGSVGCPKEEECRTSQCLRAAASVASRANHDFDPCSDFWSYSCGNWLDTNPIPDNRGSLSISDELQKNIYSHIRHLIDLIPYDENSASPRLKLKVFYKSCMDLNSIEYWVPDKLTRTIDSIGGWSLIKVPMEGQWRRDTVLMKLHVTYGVPVFFRITVEPDDANPTRNIIKLIPDGLGLPSSNYYFKPHSDPYVGAYKIFIKTLVQELGVGLNEANRFAEDIFHYEKRLADITPEPEVVRNTKNSYKRMTVDELEKLSTSISWLELLQKYYPDSVQSSTVIAVFSEKYFSDLSRLISATDKRLLNDYFMWRFVFTYVPHLSSSFRLVANHFKQTFEGVSNLDLDYEDRWEFCIRLATQHLGHAIGAMYAEHYFSPENHEDAEVFIQKLFGALSSVTNSFPWLQDGTSHEAIQQKILAASTLVGFPVPPQNVSLEAYYKELNVQVDYFQNIKNGVYFAHMKEEELLQEQATSYSRWAAYPHDVTSVYKYAGNELVVPAGLFEVPLFDFGSPLAVKYGVLAGHVADKLSKMFDDKGIYYEQYGLLRPLLSNRSLDFYHGELRCLKTALVNFSLHDVTVSPNLTIGSFISDIGGVKIAYEAYRKHEKSSESKELPGMDISNNQLFFVSYAQSLCEAVRPGKLKAFRDSNERLPAQLRVIGALKQLPEFSSAFSCGSGSKMSSEHRCRIW